MATSAIPLPHFSGKTSLSLQDLDALAERVQASSVTAEYVPASPHKGHKQYTRASFNAPVSAEDACSGAVTLPDKVGLIASVGYAPTEEPYISAGDIVLPLAHDYDPADDSSLPTEHATGGVYSINVPEQLKRPQINHGNILLPLAQSDWGDAEGAMYTPGLVYAVEQDACAGSAYIEQGVIHLPSGGSGGGGGELPLLSIAASSDETWGVNGGDFRVGLADMCAGSAGVISRVETGASLALRQGVLTVPAGGGSTLSGVVNTSGQQVTWAEMVAAPVRLAVMFLDGYRLYLTGQVVNGFLKVDTEAV